MGSRSICTAPLDVTLILWWETLDGQRIQMLDQPSKTKQLYRSSGAILGLAAGYVAMVMIGFQGMVASALFWGGGCVLGGVVAEKLFYWNNSRGQ